EKEEALASFYEKWKADTLVLDKWFAIQATAPQPDTMDRVKRLMNHPAFSIKNPNKVRSLVGAFCGANPVCYHDKRGEGYIFLADRVLQLDRLNPQIAARLLGNLSRWRRYDTERQRMMKEQLERIMGQAKLSRDVYEVAEKSLTA
ncbi:MAG: aminopeptidase N C-terminal domain-containing protein, partial [Desulfobulbaceae bacterium]|nr:aminopeptidase N C-terminal domain-containing protein [Desulfobulbaceae bacterium]